MALGALRRSEEPVGRWNPVQELEQDFGQLFDRLNRLMPSAVGQPLPGFAWMPAVDLEETDEAFVVEAELPGVKREDIDVSWRDQELSITGEVKERERKGLLRHTTRRTGHFAYRVTLPGDIDPDAGEASLHDGVLRVRLPKSQAAQARRIGVTTS